MINEAMKRAGWRAMPSDKVLAAHEARGGEWMILVKGGTSGPIRAIRGYRRKDYRPEVVAGLWMPIHPERGWLFDPCGWGESLTPTEPGFYWWRWDALHPWRVVLVLDGYVYYATDDDDSDPLSKAGGEWGGPCLGMPEGI